MTIPSRYKEYEFPAPEVMAEILSDDQLELFHLLDEKLQPFYLKMRWIQAFESEFRQLDEYAVLAHVFSGFSAFKEESQAEFANQVITANYNFGVSLRSKFEPHHKAVVRDDFIEFAQTKLDFPYLQPNSTGLSKRGPKQEMTDRAYEVKRTSRHKKNEAFKEYKAKTTQDPKEPNQPSHLD